MGKKLFIFYFFFMFIAIGLFSIENEVTRSEKIIERKKEVANPKKTFKRYFRYSNLC